MKIQYCFTLLFCYLCSSIAYSQYAGSGEYGNNIFIDCPILLYPGGNNVPVLPLLDWTDVNAATCYHVQVSSGSGFMFPVVDAKGLEKSEYKVTEPLDSYSIYYWRAEAGNESKYFGFCYYIVFFTGG